jgi:hypothetical protein
MRTVTIGTLLAAGALCAIGAANSPQVSVAVGDDRIDVKVDGALFTTLHSEPGPRKLYLHPLLTSTGKRVTRAFPMEDVQGDSTDHPHQRGVWIGAEQLSGMDFWENEPSYNNERAGTVALTDVSDARSGAGEGRFTLRAKWISPKGDSPIAEVRTMTFRAPSPAQRIIDIDLLLTAKMPVTFDDNYDAILGLRLAKEFEEAEGGKAVNAEGLTGWQQLRGARSAWVDWRATVGGEDVGVAVMDAPGNFRFPTPWHVRDYALLFASPFGFRKYNPAAAQDGSYAMKPGDELKLRYRILVHSGAIDVKSAFEEFARPSTTGRARVDGR